MTRRVFLRRTFVLLLPPALVVGAALVPSHFLAPAYPGTTIYVPPETTIPNTTLPTIPNTTIPDCVTVYVSTTQPPPTSVRICPWP